MQKKKTMNKIIFLTLVFPLLIIDISYCQTIDSMSVVRVLTFFFNKECKINNENKFYITKDFEQIDYETGEISIVNDFINVVLDTVFYDKNNTAYFLMTEEVPLSERSQGSYVYLISSIINSNSEWEYKNISKPIILGEEGRFTGKFEIIQNENLTLLAYKSDFVYYTAFSFNTIFENKMFSDSAVLGGEMCIYNLYDLELNKLFSVDTYQTNSGNSVGDPPVFEYTREISFIESNQIDFPQILVITKGTSLNQKLEKIQYCSEKIYIYDANKKSYSFRN